MIDRTGTGLGQNGIIFLKKCVTLNQLSLSCHEISRDLGVNHTTADRANISDKVQSRRGQSGEKMASVRDRPFAAISPS